MMGGTDDLTTLFDPDPGVGLRFHKGTILTWNNQTGENTVLVKGAAHTNLPIVNTAEPLTMQPGMHVAVLSAGSQFFILGRITTPGSDQIFTGGTPGIGPAFYQTNPDTAVQTSIVGGYYSKLAAAMTIRTRRVIIGGTVQVSGAGATGNARVQWYTARPPTTANPAGGTMMASITGLGATTGTEFTAEYSWPAGMRDQLVYLSYEVSLSAGVGGVDWCSVMPTRFEGKD